MSGKGDAAIAIFESGFNCAQSVFVSCAETLPMDREAALAVAGAFGGGLGSTGNVCGAVTGAIMAIGLKYPRTDPQNQEIREASIQMTREFLRRFKDLNGSIECKTLLCHDLGAPGGIQQARDRGLFKAVCPKMVRGAAEILDELMK
jgi:C_GCAxxG_C_C family probable redox protein